jgi:hypothetical protein
MFSGAIAFAKSVSRPQIVAVTMIGMEATTQNEKRTAALQSELMQDVAAMGYKPVRGYSICDDPQAGAEALGAKYNIIVLPWWDWSKAELTLYRTGNRVPLRKATLLLRTPGDRRLALQRLFDSAHWSVAYTAHHGC